MASRSGKAESWHWSNSVKVCAASKADSLALESSFRELDALGLKGPILEAAYGGVLARKGFYLEAADAFRRVLAVTTNPEIRLTLGDIDLAIGLHRRSEMRFREALDNDSIAVRAAALFGLGRVEYSRARYHEARTHFHQARILYSELGLEEELKAALLAEEKSSANSPK